ncbi:uncharacterized protein LOC116345385 [Contarinia nasturtii]|uniref:uncharacterized protein LOC116345385 n=1 Tax=Contarinia nasturtii TaxID=265458 RepID=UPI0012D4AA30|nr:uncharacterized protein LOC116345385 [Contarinia nasturtii]
MGISCDFEAGSMESEIKPTYNKEFIKFNGQHVLDAIPAKTATTISTNDTTKTDPIANIPSINSTIDDSKSTDEIINLTSPVSQEPETIVIIDDGEREEGEIINSDEDFEYEAISSEEEVSLRQKIEALEAKNRELEKIASISARGGIDYGYRRSPNYYKSPTIIRSNHTKSNASLSSASNYKTLSLSHVENISSDEAQVVNIENELSSVFDSSKYGGRSHRTKKEKRQSRRKQRSVVNEKERCIAHGKRRCTDAECYPIDVIIGRKKRTSHKYEDRKTARGKYSSDSEDELLRNREELKMALNIIEPSNRSVNSSTLSHKLSAIQNHVTLDDGKKTISASSSKHRKRKTIRSPERRKRTRSRETMPSKRKRIERDRIDSSRTKIPPNQDNNNENDIQIEEDEVMSLEEQELRLIALKSAVLKKHEARKRKQLATQLIEQVVRPYSPTDSVVLVADETGEQCSNDCIDSDNNNMDISPISSPGNQYQPMDMDLASSNENSKSPIFSYEKPQQFPPYEQFIDWGTVHIPVPINPSNPTYMDIDSATAALNQPFDIQSQSAFSSIFDTIPNEAVTIENRIPTPFQSDSKENNAVNADNEEELRAQLIEQMRSTNTPSSNGTIDAIGKNVTKENSNDDSLEEDCLRSLLLSSKGKKSAILKESTNDSTVTKTLPKTDKIPSNQDKCDDMPKLALNLREALKRLKNNQQNKLAAAAAAAATASATTMTTTTTVVPATDPVKSASVQLGSKQSEQVDDKLMQNCDHNEIQKTAVNNQLDKNENDARNSKIVIETPAVVPLKSLQNITPVQNAEETVSTMPSDIVQKIDKLAVPQVDKSDAKKMNVVIAIPTKVARPTKEILTKIVEPGPVTKQNVVTKPKAKPKPIEQPLSLATSVLTKIPPTINTTTNLNKIESIRKSTASPIITNWTAKPVKKLIISLQDDSSTDDTDYDDKSTNKQTDNDSTSQSNDVNNAFQSRLDHYLQIFRESTTTKQETKPSVKLPASPNNETVEKTTNSTPKTQNVEPPKAVALLPLSSQMEYHRLQNRIKLLEKQKDQKSRKRQTSITSVNVPTSKPESNFPSLTVVVQNDNRFIQTNKTSELEDVTKSPVEVIKIPTVIKVSTTKTPTVTSLAKKVLVKNAMAQATDANAKISTVKSAATTSTTPMQIATPPEQTVASTSADIVLTTQSKPVPSTGNTITKKAPTMTATTLANYVVRYKNYGEQYLNGLTKLHRLTCRTHLETRKQQKLEDVLDNLRRQTILVEKKLTQQKTVTKSFYPSIAATEKAITADRSMMLKLESLCNRVGNIVNGPDYKIQCEKAAEIKEKLKQIALEKNKMKLLGQKMPETQPVKQPTKLSELAKKEVATKKVIENASIPSLQSSNPVQKKEDTVKTSKPTMATSSPAKFDDNKINVSLNSNVEKNKEIEIICEPISLDTQVTQKIEHVEMEVDVVSKSDEKTCQPESETETKIENPKENVEIMRNEPEQKEQEKEVDQNEPELQFNQNNECETVEADEQPSSPDNLTAPIMMMEVNVTDSEAICGKYDSPLDHMQNCTNAKEELSVADRNAIVCPYDLMGRCEDKQCEYKHLSV